MGKIATITEASKKANNYDDSEPNLCCTKEFVVLLGCHVNWNYDSDNQLVQYDDLIQDVEITFQTGYSFDNDYGVFCIANRNVIWDIDMNCILAPLAGGEVKMHFRIWANSARCDPEYQPTIHKDKWHQFFVSSSVYDEKRMIASFKYSFVI